MKTVEKNIIIAQFMGAKHLIDYGEIQVFEMPQGKTYSIHNLDFHKSWDWLMPVVEKCYEFGELGSDERTEIEESLTGIINIRDTFKAVFKFVRAYNESKSVNLKAS